MGLGQRRSEAADDPARVDQLALRARAGDRAARDELLTRYRPFVLAVASRCTGRFVRPEDDEASVGLIAFNEAIDGFDPARGGSFLGFAETVIRRRLIDHIRRDRRFAAETPWSGLVREDEEGDAWDAVEARAALGAHAGVEAVERRDEIERYRRRLAEFGLALWQLPDICPRHADARQAAIAVARLVAQERAYAEHLLRTRTLPLAELERDPRVGVSRKTLERQRRFIVAVALILMGDFPELRRFIPGS